MRTFRSGAEPLSSTKTEAAPARAAAIALNVPAAPAPTTKTSTTPVVESPTSRRGLLGDLSAMAVVSRRQGDGALVRMSDDAEKVVAG